MTGAEWKKAKPELEQVTEALPDFGPGQNNLAFVLHQLGDLEGAKKSATLASEIAPGNPDFMDTLAVILLDQGDAQGALTLLERASGRPSQSATTIKYHMAKALAALKRNDESKDILTKILAGKIIFRERKDAEALLEKLSE
jgi:Flp pilus assembly protein TadD